MKRTRSLLLLPSLAAGLLVVTSPRLHSAEVKAHDGDVILRALKDELRRSQTLRLDELEAPYFIEYAVTNTTTHQIAARQGALVRTDRSHSRQLETRVRVGAYDLDNTNFRGGGRGGFRGGGMSSRGRVTTLPSDDHYHAIRQAAWLATDREYKRAAETYAAKKAYLQDRETEDDRPSDFSRIEAPTVRIGPIAQATLDTAIWSDRIRHYSNYVLNQPGIANGEADIVAVAQNKYLLNSEGTAIRTGRVRTAITISASIRLASGESISDHRTFYVRDKNELPEQSEVEERIRSMTQDLVAIAAAPKIESYTGPVLFESVATAQLFNGLLSSGLRGSPESLGSSRRRSTGSSSLSRYLGKRILPRDLSVYDDPTGDAETSEIFFAGRYAIDDEGVPSQRVDLVIDGKLEGLLMSRQPTKEFNESNGHGRRTAGGGTRPSVGCLFIKSNDGLSEADLKARLLEEADDQGLEFALKVTALRGGGQGTAADRMAFYGQSGGGRFRGGGGLSQPFAMYRVDVESGEETLLRGLEFDGIDVRMLRDIVAAGDDLATYNCLSTTSGPPTTISAPSVILEEIDLIESERGPTRAPYLPAPKDR